MQEIFPSDLKWPIDVQIWRASCAELHTNKRYARVAVRPDESYCAHTPGLCPVVSDTIVSKHPNKIRTTENAKVFVVPTTF